MPMKVTVSLMITITLLASLAALIVPSTALLIVSRITPSFCSSKTELTIPQARQDNEQAAMCANSLIFTNAGSVCCPGVLQTHDDAQYCCVGNNIPNATYCGDHAETYDPQTASCSASFKIGIRGYTSSVLAAGSKYTVTKAVNPTPVTMNGATSTSCKTVTMGVATGVASATSMSTRLAQPAITAPALLTPMMAVGGLLLAL